MFQYSRKMNWNFFSYFPERTDRPSPSSRLSPIPDECSRSYIPIDIVTGDEADMQRHIFGKSFADAEMSFSAFELAKVRELDGIWGDSGDPLAGTGLEETQKLRFLQGCGWDVTKAAEGIRNFVEWKTSQPPTPNLAPDRSDPHTWLYFSGRDRCFRPIMIIDCLCLIEEKGESHSLTFVQEAVVDAMNYFVDHLAVPGHVEQVIVIADLNGCSVWNAPIEEMEKCALTLTSRFRGRLNKLFLVNTPLVFYAFWSVIKVFIPERTLSKIFLIRYNHLEELSKYIDDDQIDPVLRQDITGSS